MTTNALSAGGSDPLTDLLFSSRAAFIWDHSKAAVSWMNAAARGKFGLAADELSRMLPRDAAETLSSFVKPGGGSLKTPGFLVLKLPKRRRGFFSMEFIELADGAPGAIVTETGRIAGQAPPASLPIRKPAKKRVVKKRNSPAPVKLTPRELQSFKSIGKAVFKLCGEKQASTIVPLPGAFPSSAFECAGSRNKPPRESLEPFLSASSLLGAFDLVLYLDRAGKILQCDGRPQRIGWRKSSLTRASAACLFPDAERGVFWRMTAQLDRDSSAVNREVLLLRDEAGEISPCCAIVAPVSAHGAHYLLALLSFKLPQRLKKHYTQSLKSARPTRLAA